MGLFYTSAAAPGCCVAFSLITQSNVLHQQRAWRCSFFVFFFCSFFFLCHFMTSGVAAHGGVLRCGVVVQTVRSSAVMHLLCAVPPQYTWHKTQFLQPFFFFWLSNAVFFFLSTSIDKLQMSDQRCAPPSCFWESSSYAIATMWLRMRALCFLINALLAWVHRWSTARARKNVLL